MRVAGEDHYGWGGAKTLMVDVDGCNVALGFRFFHEREALMWLDAIFIFFFIFQPGFIMFTRDGLRPSQKRVSERPWARRPFY